MSRFINALLWAIPIIFVATVSKAGEDGHEPTFLNTHTQTHISQLKPIPPLAYKIASARFLPDVDDTEIGFNNKDYIKKNHNKEDNCKAYEFTNSTCTRNRSLFVPCPFNRNYYKSCYCDQIKYKYTRYNCKYSGTEHDIDYALGNNRCYDDNAVPKSASCECRYLFDYTDNASCKDSKKIIDTSSFCEDADMRRYEKCKCDPERFPKKFNGNTNSQEFKNLIRKNVGILKTLIAVIIMGRLFLIGATLMEMFLNIQKIPARLKMQIMKFMVHLKVSPTAITNISLYTLVAIVLALLLPTNIVREEST